MNTNQIINNEMLLEAAIEARDWLRRSCRIDDQEMADDLNVAIERCDASNPKTQAANTATT